MCPGQKHPHQASRVPGREEVALWMLLEGVSLCQGFDMSGFNAPPGPECHFLSTWHSGRLVAPWVFPKNVHPHFVLG